jgi:chemotaxis protein CheY-P-specific phosphatase CheC
MEKRLNTEFVTTVRNIGQAAAQSATSVLRQLLSTDVRVPTPTVNLLEPTELQMALSDPSEGGVERAICQSFIGRGIAGEALLTIRHLGNDTAALLLNTDPPDSDMEATELVLDIANILIGACLSGLSGQIEIAFTQNHPMLLASDWREARQRGSNHGNGAPMLALEMPLRFSDVPIEGEVLLVLAPESVTILERHLTYLQ